MGDIRYRSDGEMVDSGVEWLGKVPQEWTQSKIKNYYSYLKGRNDQRLTKEYIALSKSVYPVYSGQTENDGIMGYIEEYEFDLEKCLFTTTVGAKVMTPMILKGKFSLSQNCLIMRKKMDEINDIFVYYWLHPLFRFEKSLIPSHMQPSLRMEDLNKYNIAVPILSEQEKIANFLDIKTSQFDKIIAKKQELIEKLEEAKKSLISEVVTGKVKIVDGKLIARDESEMVDSGVEEFGKVAKYFKLSKIKFHGDFKAGISKGAGYFGTGYPFISYSDVYNNKEITKASGLAITSNGERVNFSIKAKDILFTRTSESIDDIGVSCMCKADVKDGTYSGFIIRYRLRNKDDFDYNFIKFYFQNQVIKRYFASQLNIVTRASLSQERLKELLFILPEYEEQKLIGEYLELKTENIQDIIQKTKLQIQKLTQAKQSLISEAVTGKIDLRDWEIKEFV